MIATPSISHIVVFGLQKSGKSDFVAACRSLEPQINWIDTDSSENELLLTALQLPDSIIQADALAITVDISIEQVELKNIVNRVNHFLSQLENKRIECRAITNWPIAVILTKCDRLLGLAQTAAEWQSRIQERAEYIRRELQIGIEQYDHSFGSIQITIDTIATRSPAIAGAPTDQIGSYQLVAVAQRLAQSARDYHQRKHASNRQLNVLSFTTIGLLTTFLVAAVISSFFTGTDFEDKLTQRIRQYQLRERPPAIRLSDARRPRGKAELIAIKDDPSFDSLPNDLKDYVEDRIGEMDRYDNYLKRFRRQAPSESRSLSELDLLAADMKTTLSPTREDAIAWEETDAIKLRNKWAHDIDLLRTAETQLHDWYRQLTRRAHELILVLPDSKWNLAVHMMLRESNVLPFQLDEIIADSTEVALTGGEKLTYAVAYEFDRVDSARREWEYTKDKLTRLQDLATICGLIQSTGQPPTQSTIFEASIDSIPFPNSMTQLLQALRKQYPVLVLEPHRFAKSFWPDASRDEFHRRLSRTYESIIHRLREHIRKMVLQAGEGKETYTAWKSVENAIRNDPGLRDAGTILSILSQLKDDVPADPLLELQLFLTKSSFEIKPLILELAVPEERKGEKVTVADILKIQNGENELSFPKMGDSKTNRGERIDRFSINSFEVKPNQIFSASIPIQAGTTAYRLHWKHGRSSVFPFDRFQSEPDLIDSNNRTERGTGIRVRLLPDGHWPMLPLLLPDFSAMP